MKPERWRINVDLPEPEAPINATISPRASCRLTRSSAWHEAKRLLSARTSMAAVVILAALVMGVTHRDPRIGLLQFVDNQTTGP